MTHTLKDPWGSFLGYLPKRHESPGLLIPGERLFTESDVIGTDVLNVPHITNKFDVTSVRDIISVSDVIGVTSDRGGGITPASHQFPASMSHVAMMTSLLTSLLRCRGRCRSMTSASTLCASRYNATRTSAARRSTDPA